MTETQGVYLPPILTYPSQPIRDQLPSDEWTACLDLWISSLQIRLSLTDSQLSKLSAESAGVNFLSTYLSTYDVVQTEKESRHNELRRLCYSLTRRLLKIRNDQVTAKSNFDLLASGSIAFRSTKGWSDFLKTLWTSNSPPATSDRARIRKAVESAKGSLVLNSSAESQVRILRQLSALTLALPETTTLTVAGADYLDTLKDIYNGGSDQLRGQATANLFYSFQALMRSKHIAILTDDIYHLKSEADQMLKSQPDQRTLLSSLLCTTTLLKHLLSNVEMSSKKTNLLDQLTHYRDNMAHLHPLPIRRSKGKSKVKAHKDDDMHMHRATQISQVQELFPDLSNAYVMKCLDHFSGSSEQTIAALLEPDSLPAGLVDQHVVDTGMNGESDLNDLEPRPTPPLLPRRNGLFEDDAFSRLEISTDQIRRGKKDLSQELNNQHGHAKSKAAILSALAAFDSDDDERDDTYDVADVGGAVDNTVDTDSRPRQPAGQELDQNEAVLFKMFKEDPKFFDRDSKTRMSNLRSQIKRETGMSDEQIEGWAVMLKRDPKMEQRMEQKYSAVRAFAGSQKSLQSTKWQANTSAENSEIDSGTESANDGRRMGQAGIRGHRDWSKRGGRGSSMAGGPADDVATQAARRRKEQGRGRGGSSNRRAGRARKMARGMGPLPPS